MRMTNEQLIDAAHKAAKYLPPASAQLMSDLATQLDVALVAARTACAERNELEARCVMLAAESLFIHDVLVRLAKARPGGCDFDDWDALVADALNHPTTSAFLAEVLAQGVEMFARSLTIAGGGEHPYSTVANEFAAQLRQEA